MFGGYKIFKPDRQNEREIEVILSVRLDIEVTVLNVNTMELSDVLIVLVNLQNNSFNFSYILRSCSK